MPHISLKEGLPGIRGPMAFRPETTKPLCELVDVLLRDTRGISPGERELIATFVSSLNDCLYCQTTHGWVAAAHLGKDDDTLVKKVKADYLNAPISEKLKALLTIAKQVHAGGKKVTSEAVQAARALGATDLEVHDTVLIAAAFCMYNRYVDGLATWTHDDQTAYRERGKQVAKTGYVNANLPVKAT